MRNTLKLISLIILFLFPLTLQAGESTIKLHLKGVSCPFCVYGIEKRLKKVPGIDGVTTQYKASTSTLKKEPKSPIDIDALYKAVKDAGFSLDSVDLTIHGSLINWKGKTALKAADSGQVFLLVDPSQKEANESLSTKMLKKLLVLSNNKSRPITVSGKAHAHKGMPPAIAVSEYRRAP